MTADLPSHLPSRWTKAPSETPSHVPSYLPSRCYGPTMILTIGGRKGGLGKSTVCTYLACLLAQDSKVIIVDADPQGSLLSWSEEAGEGFGPAVVAWPTRDLARRVREIASSYDHVVIDTGRAPSDDDPILRQALQISDVLIIPTAPSLIEVREISKVLDMVEEIEPLHHVEVHVLLNRVRAGTKSAKEAREGLESAGLPLFKAQIGMRETYSQAWGTVIADFGEFAYIRDELLAEVKA
jgi:chromosome partitioning protein